MNKEVLMSVKEHQQMSYIVFKRVEMTDQVHALLKTSTMGIWQLCAISSVMGCRLVSVYPQRGNRIVRRDLHRLIE